MDRYFWTGNSAKARVTREILATTERDGRKTVFDFGAGRGGDWPTILEATRGIDLVCYEPNPRLAAEARDRLAPFGATVHTGPDTGALQFRADFVVSFSVFEHVKDRRRYLQEAVRLLAPRGRFYLNYDDGHFRPMLALADRSSWVPAIRGGLHNLLAPLLGERRYQSRVNKKELDGMIADLALEVLEERYECVASFKALAKVVPPERSERFVAFWVTIEDRLNAEFRARTSPYLGDDVNLWRELGARTLTLQRRR